MITARVDEAGRLTGFTKVTRDMTEHKRVEDELVEARHVAEAANRAKDDFLSSMSHELRTPLNSVIGFTQLLADDVLLNADQQECVDYVAKAARHLLDLINDVLDVARVSSGQLSTSPEPVGVSELVSDAVALVQPMALERSIQITVENRSGLHVQADRQRLKQVLLNLLSNAIKYNQLGGQVVVTWDKAGPGQVRINVRDTGNGLTGERMARLFVPFDRLGAEATGTEGTGLGLALSKRLVEAMYGTLTASSEPGQGSTFSVELAAAEAPTAMLDRQERHVNGFTGGALRILYIEDNLANLRLMQRILRKRPAMELMPAMQGGLGLDLARQHQPELILLDLHLPDMGGEEVLTSLQADPATQHIPVIVMSGDARPARVDRLREQGVHGYLSKPIDLGEFLDVIDGYAHTAPRLTPVRGVRGPGSGQVEGVHAFEGEVELAPVVRLGERGDAGQVLGWAGQLDHGLDHPGPDLVEAVGQRRAHDVPSRQVGERSVRFALVPVRHRGVVVGEVVRVPVLDRPPQRPVEADGVGHVPAVHPHQTPEVVVLHQVEPGVGPAELHERAGARPEHLLVARAVDPRRPGVVVDEDHVVALPVPPTGQVVDLEHQAHHLALPLCLESHVVGCAVQVGSVVELHVGRLDGRHRRPLLAVLRVEAQHVVPGRRIEHLVLHVVPEHPHQATQVGVRPVLHLDAGTVSEGHGEVGVEPGRTPHARIHRGERAGVLPDAAVAHPEEVAERHLHRRHLLTIPPAPEDGVAMIGELVGGQGHVDAGDAARAVDLEQRDALAGPDLHAVEVAAAAIPRRRPPARRSRRLEQVAHRMVIERMRHPVILSPGPEGVSRPAPHGCGGGHGRLGARCQADPTGHPPERRRPLADEPLGTKASTSPLTGLRVVEVALGLSVVGAGMASSLPGALLRDLGADVVRIESADRSSLDGGLDLSLAWNRGKEIVLVANDDAVETIVARVADADVVVLAGAEELIEERGLGYADLARSHPRLVGTRIRPSVNAKGAMADVELLVQARAGLPAQIRGHRSGPVFPTLPIASAGAALSATVGVLALLYQREASGVGGWAETSLYDGLQALLPMIIGRVEHHSPSTRLLWHEKGPTDGLAYRCADDGYIQLWFGAKGAYEAFLEQMEDEPSEQGYNADLTSGAMAERSQRWAARFATHDRAWWLDELAGRRFRCRAGAAPGRVAVGSAGDRVGTCRPPPRPIGSVRSRWSDRSSGSTRPAYPLGPDPPILTTSLLSDVRVLDLSAFLAGPDHPAGAGRTGCRRGQGRARDRRRTSQHGADVRRRTARQASRGPGPEVPRAAAALGRLFAWSDVVHHNSRVGVAERLGYDEATVRAANPEVVYSFASGFGPTGPRALLPANDHLMQALSGAEAAQGGWGRPPTFVAWGAIDVTGGWIAACGVLAGLYARRRTGAGQSVSTSLLGASLALESGAFVADGAAVAAPVLDADQTGYGAAYRLYQGADGEWFALAASDTDAWTRLISRVPAAGLPDQPPGLRTTPGERQPAEVLLEDVFGSRPAAAWVAALRDAGVAVEVVADVDRSAFTGGFVDDPVNRALGRVVTYSWGDRGQVDQPAFPPRMGPGTVPGAPGGIAGLGEHTAQVLDEAGVTAEELAACVEEGAVPG